jgi:hypothetical protein
MPLNVHNFLTLARGPPTFNQSINQFLITPAILFACKVRAAMRLHFLYPTYMQVTYRFRIQTIYRVFQKELCSGMKTFILKGLQTVHCSRCWIMASLYAFKCTHFPNTHHTETFGIEVTINIVHATIFM